MRKSGVFLSASLVLASGLALAQHNGHEPPPDIQQNFLINFTEITTGFAAALLAFQAALAFREGRLGKGMTWVAVGMVVMAIGHLILVVRRFAGVDPLGFLGPTGSFVAFSIAVFASFIASAFGFWSIRRAAKQI
jgi:hypothetical protein